MFGKVKLTLLSVVMIAVLGLTACTPANLALQLMNSSQNTSTATPAAPAATDQNSAPATTNQGAPVTAPAVIGDWEAMQETLEQIYEKVNPSVVNIRVLEQMDVSSSDPFGLFPDGQQQQGQTPVQEAQGSGFVWDKEGHIVTNNHVVDGATQVTVVFSDGYTVDAKVVGTDVNSDLAVIQVDVPQERLYPVQLADSDQVKVGQLAIAIGNPFGLSGTQTVGFISALGRSLNVQSSASSTGSYSIPDIIQTDAPINPGNSGGVLVNDVGQVVGVTSAIQSSTDSSAGIGFVIPSAIVQRVIPSLIQNGKYDYPWIGIAGTDLTRDLAQANGLDDQQRGALVTEVNDGGPAANAGLKGATDTTSVNGQDLPVGGDVITKIDGTPVTKFDDIVSYLIGKTQPGQSVTLTVLRDGKEQEIQVVLGTRPSESDQNQQASQGFGGNNGDNGNNGNNDQNGNPAPNQQTAQASLGITGVTLNAEIAAAMNLDRNQAGVLVQQVSPNSGAELAGIKGGDQEQTINGEKIILGGDVITGFDGKAITTFQELRDAVSTHAPGDEVQVTLLRDGAEHQVSVILGYR